MAFPRRLARFNRVVTNHVARPLAARLPGFAVVVHTGRRSGRRYRTPVNAFRRDGTFVVALTYTSGSDWVANVLKAGGCELVRGGRTIAIDDVELVRGDMARSSFPRALRGFLRRVGVDEALVLRPAETSRSPRPEDA